MSHVSQDRALPRTSEMRLCVCARERPSVRAMCIHMFLPIESQIKRPGCKRATATLLFTKKGVLLQLTEWAT